MKSYFLYILEPEVRGNKLFQMQKEIGEEVNFYTHTVNHSWE